MKKFVSVILAFVLAFSTVSASAGQLPEFFSDTPLNYTADYSYSVSFENSDNLIALFKELEVYDSISRYIDIKALAESLLSTGVKMKLQADMSSDFRKVKVALTSDTQYDVIVNSNLEIDVDAKMGMWVNMDLNAQEPVFEVIYSYPMLNKYMVFNLFELIPDAEERDSFLKALDLVFSKEYIDSVTEFSSQLMAKYAEVSLSGTSCTVTIKNDGLISMIKELIPFVMSSMDELLAAMGNSDLSADFVIPAEDEYDLSVLDELQILGKDGVTFKYSLISGKISHADMTADISLNIEDMIASITGTEWEYEADGVLELSVKATVKMSKYGSTSPDFPKLTKDNSFTAEDLLPETYADEEEMYVPEYPHFYVWADANELPVINGEYYVPLRSVLESAYSKTVELEYNNGVVTAVCEHFPGFKTLKLIKDSSTAFTDGKQISVSKVIIKDGTTYVGRTLFENLFGWELDEITHYILDNSFCITFYTEKTE